MLHGEHSAWHGIVIEIASAYIGLEGATQGCRGKKGGWVGEESPEKKVLASCHIGLYHEYGIPCFIATSQLASYGTDPVQFKCKLPITDI